MVSLLVFYGISTLADHSIPNSVHIYIYIYISWLTVAESYPKAPLSIATTLRYREGRYSFSLIRVKVRLTLAVRRDSVSHSERPSGTAHLAVGWGHISNSWQSSVFSQQSWSLRVASGVQVDPWRRPVENVSSKKKTALNLSVAQRG